MNYDHAKKLLRMQTLGIEKSSLEGLHGLYRWLKPGGEWVFDLHVGECIEWIEDMPAADCDFCVTHDSEALSALIERSIDPLNLFNRGALSIEAAHAEGVWEARARVEKLLNIILTRLNIDAAAKRHIEELSVKGNQFLSCPRVRTELDLAEAMAVGSPAIVDVACDSWPLAQMAPSQIAACLSQLEVSLLVSEYDTNKGNGASYRKTGFAQYVQDLYDGVPVQGYMAANVIPADLDGTYEYPMMFPKAAFNKPRWWVGPKGSGLKLHRDLVDNFLYQIRGSKKIRLFSPSESMFLYPEIIGGNPFYEPSHVNPERVDHVSFPLFKQACSVICELHAGEMLYLPAGWWHHVINREISWSLNFFAVNQKPFVLQMPADDKVVQLCVSE